jgi:clan AA aspartic protease (TIGR02281 family)
MDILVGDLEVLSAFVEILIREFTVRNFDPEMFDPENLKGYAVTYRRGLKDTVKTSLLVTTLVATLSTSAYLLAQAAQDNGVLANNTSVAAAQVAYKEGVKLYRDGEFKHALEKLSNAYQKQPENANVRYYMAICYDKLVRYGDAVTHYGYVARHGTDPQVVDYAKYRMTVLQDKLGDTVSFEDATKEDSGKTVALVNTSFKANHKASKNKLTTNSINSPDIDTSQVAFNPAMSSAKTEVGVVPLKRSSQALMLEATLNHQTVGTFILDTGATYTSISREMAEEMGLDLINAPKVRITTANGRIEVPKVLIQTLNVNGVEAHNVEATVIDIRKGSSFAGLLGLSFIKKFKLTIDPVAGQLIFQPNELAVTAK